MCKRSILSIFKPKLSDAAIRETERDGFYLPAGRRLGSAMIHRADIAWIEATTAKDGILGFIRANPAMDYFPVCAKTVDSVLGILSARAFLESLLEPVWPGLKSLVSRPLYLPETVTIARALSLLSSATPPLAMIVDEYGGIEGLVTREGLVSELTAEFLDTDNAGEEDIFEREDGSWLVDGQTRMDEIREKFALPDTDAADYYTLAGYLLAVNGSIPKTGERIEAGDYLCEIVDMDGHRIDKILVSKKKD